MTFEVATAVATIVTALVLLIAEAIRLIDRRGTRQAEAGMRERRRQELVRGIHAAEEDCNLEMDRIARWTRQERDRVRWDANERGVLYSSFTDEAVGEVEEEGERQRQAALRAMERTRRPLRDELDDLGPPTSV